MTKVYISSTYSDLKEHRTAVYHTLRQMGHDAIAMEDYVATDQRPVDKCLADVAACDVYIGIFAWRYGYVSNESNPRQLSITELEYRMAGDTLKPRLIFLIDDNAPWPAKQMDAITGENDNGRRIADLRVELKQSSITSFFISAEQLANLVGVAIQQLAARSQAAYQLYIDHMQRFAGARSEDDALSRYVPLRLQDTQIERSKQGGSLPIGTWEDRIRYPAAVMLVGDAGSGKTTSILHEAQRLARYAMATPAVPHPVYFSLNTFKGSNLSDLLAQVAVNNRMTSRELQALWRERQRPLVLFLDGADEMLDRQSLGSVVTELFSDGAGAFHSAVITCRPGTAQQLLRERVPSLHEMLLLPLDDLQIDQFLGRYHAGSLRSLLDQRLREVLQRPDVLSALSQAARESQLTNIPSSAGQIYQLYVEQLLRKGAGTYDATYVKHPILTLLAHRLVIRGQRELVCDDDLYDEIASRLSQIHRRYHRHRQLMPHDWSAEGLINELLTTLVLERAPGSVDAVQFSKRFYRDYFLATFLADQGVGDSPFLRRLLTTPNPDEWYQALSILLGIAPAAAKVFDHAPNAAVSLVAQLWFEHAPPGVAAPEPLQQIYALTERDFKIALASAAAEPRPSPHPGNPQERYQHVLQLAQEPVRAIDALLDLAADDHPIVRAAAQYALLRWGDENYAEHNQLIVLTNGGTLRCAVSGGGIARIGPYTLIELTHPAAARIVVNIHENDIDPFESHSLFHFLHTPPDLVAATFFESSREINWIHLLINLRRIALLSMQTVRQAQGRAQLSAVFPEFLARASSFAAFGQLIAQDLRIPWEPIDLPEGMSVSPELMEQSYFRLRRLYSRGNQERALLAAQSENDANIQVAQAINTSTKGTVAGIQLDEIRIDEQDRASPERYVFASFTQNISLLEESVLVGFRLQLQQSNSALLPLVLRVNGTINIKDSQSSVIRGYCIDAFEGQAYGWKADIVININRSSKSVIEGIVAREPNLDNRNKRP